MIGEKSESLVTDFLACYKQENTRRYPIQSDASFRYYERLVSLDGSSLVLMCTPLKEDIYKFIYLSDFLRNIGLSVPRIIAIDVNNGFLLLEDFGENTYTYLLSKGGNERTLYKQAIDVIITIHRHTQTQSVASKVLAYDNNILQEEVNLLINWYTPIATNVLITQSSYLSYEQIWKRLFTLARNIPEALALRDFHVGNLVKLAGRFGTRACGLLDFQDAVIAPVTYDLMSLLEDVRYDVYPSLSSAMINRYRIAFPDLDPEAFTTSWVILAAQRHTRVLGTFARLLVLYNKPMYALYIKRVRDLLKRTCRHPSLCELSFWFKQHNLLL